MDTNIVLGIYDAPLLQQHQLEAFECGHQTNYPIFVLQ